MEMGQCQKGKRTDRSGSVLIAGTTTLYFGSQPWADGLQSLESNYVPDYICSVWTYVAFPLPRETSRQRLSNEYEAKLFFLQTRSEVFFSLSQALCRFARIVH